MVKSGSFNVIKFNTYILFYETLSYESPVRLVICVNIF